MRLIDSDALKNTFCNQCDLSETSYTVEDCRKAGCGFMRNIDDAPTIEAEPVKHGEWIDTDVPNVKAAECSLCGFCQRTSGEDKTGKHMIHKAVYRYCAGCGAKMDGGD